MMQQMRENTKWIMLVTALAFVALMVFEWGMDMTGRSSMGVGQIGTVNGAPVMYDDYMATYRNLYDRVQRQQERVITSQQNREIEDAAWEEHVNQILIRQELQRRGIRVTDEEIQQAARFSPPPAIRQDAAFQTEGQFDIQKYQNYLATSADRALLLQLEQYYRQVIPQSKLVRQVTSGVYVSDAELWRRWRDRNEQARVRFASLQPGSRIPDSAVSVPDAEIRTYYEENREDFAVPARATVKVVSLNKAPTPEDTAAVLEQARDVRREIVEGADFAEVARRESADSATVEEGGDLGTIGRGQLTPALEEAVFGARPGEVLEPVKTGSGYHIVEVRERTADSVTVGQILIPVERTDDSEIRMLNEADSLEALAEDMTLESAARELGLSVRTVDINEDYPVAPGVGQMGEGVDWIFSEAVPGDVSPLFENDRSFYALELVSTEPAGYRSLAEVRPTIGERLRLERKMDRAVALGREIAEAARARGSLNAVADEHRLRVGEAGPFARVDFVPGLGRRNEAVGAAFGLADGEISDPVRTQSDVILLQLLERIPADSTAWTEQKQAQRRQLLAQIQNTRFEEWIGGLREQAEIEDRRDEVLRALEEQQPAGGGGIPPMF